MLTSSKKFMQRAATHSTRPRDLAHVQSDVTIEGNSSVNLKLAEIEDRLGVSVNLKIG